jgi:hypothetical protein
VGAGAARHGDRARHPDRHARSPLTDRLVYSKEELLESDGCHAPLVAGGVRCHGGFDADGAYRSPRVRHRGPAILAWQARLAREGAALVEVPRELMPPQYPNLAQSKLLLRAGVRDPIVRALTIISIVEGFGAIIRDVEVPDLGALVREPIEGTALAHLRGALFEAHARDESGYRDEGGHKQMWEAARDLAFEKPRIPGDVLMRMMGRGRRDGARERLFPQIDETLEALLGTMVQVLVVEVFAMGTFAWGEALLSDPEVSAAPKQAADLVRFIRSDESPHVEYLRTALSELRARTLHTIDGRAIAGRTVVDGILHRVLSAITKERPKQQREDVRRDLAVALETAGRPSSLIEEFDQLESRWTPPSRTGFEPPLAASA